MRLNHITLPASDVETSAAFYVRLGLIQLVANYPHYARLLAPDGDTTLSLHQATGAIQNGASIHFEVQDVDQTVERLQRAGFQFVCDPVDQPYLWREAVLLDPDEHRIFIFHAGENRIDPPWRLIASLGDRIYRRARLAGEFRLRSGVTSSEYFDKYLFESDPRLLREIADELVGLLPAGVGLLAGLELGGVPLAVVASQVSGLPSVFVRKAAKTYGTCRLAEGGEVAGQRIAVIEDVVTSGGQAIESCRELRNRGADVAAVLCVIDREAGGRDNLAAEGLDLRTLFTMSQLRATAPARS